MDADDAEARGQVPEEELADFYYHIIRDGLGSWLDPTSRTSASATSDLRAADDPLPPITLTDVLTSKAHEEPPIASSNDAPEAGWQVGNRRYLETRHLRRLTDAIRWRSPDGQPIRVAIATAIVLVGFIGLVAATAHHGTAPAYPDQVVAANTTVPGTTSTTMTLVARSKPPSIGSTPPTGTSVPTGENIVATEANGTSRRTAITGETAGGGSGFTQTTGVTVATTSPPTTFPPTTFPPTTIPPTTIGPTTIPPTTVAPTTSTFTLPSIPFTLPSIPFTIPTTVPRTTTTRPSPPTK